MRFLGSLILLCLFLYAKNYDFYAQIDKKNIIMGEEFTLTYIFKYPKNKQLAEINFSEPLFENFKIKRRVDYNETIQKDFKIIKKSFILTAKKDGTLTIEPAYLDIAISKGKKKRLGEYEDIDFDYKSFETKPINILVTSLSADTKLYGDFNISTFVDKTNINANQPINLTITITSNSNIANIDSIESFNLNIKDVTIYKNLPIIKNNKFTQKFTILSDKSYTIPLFEIKYFNPTLKRLETKKTKPIYIKVKREKKEIENHQKKETKYSAIFMILTFLIGFLSGFLYNKIKRYKKQNRDIKLIEKIKNSKDTKEALKILLSSDKKEKYYKLIKELEDDIYITKKNSITIKKIRASLKTIHSS